jgi:hypothetical protein
VGTGSLGRRLPGYSVVIPSALRSFSTSGPTAKAIRSVRFADVPLRFSVALERLTNGWVLRSRHPADFHLSAMLRDTVRRSCSEFSEESNTECFLETAKIKFSKRKLGRREDADSSSREADSAPTPPKDSGNRSRSVDGHHERGGVSARTLPARHPGRVELRVTGKADQTKRARVRRAAKKEGNHFGQAHLQTEILVCLVQRSKKGPAMSRMHKRLAKGVRPAKGELLTHLRTWFATAPENELAPMIWDVCNAMVCSLDGAMESRLGFLFGSSSTADCSPGCGRFWRSCARQVKMMIGRGCFFS